ncbi:hypothetical protein [Planococcus sp. CAU13]|uniref:hypothetical protein n=1 Tax=Planococcus sp. CAU13 TaxID=1541197 RepID=UPI000B0F3130|nr:hypothetical protein [Planococcus sp. CAU13]
MKIFISFLLLATVVALNEKPAMFLGEGTVPSEEVNLPVPNIWQYAVIGLIGLALIAVIIYRRRNKIN